MALDFAVRIVELSKYLQTEKSEYIISKQILRSGTSIGANIAESQGAQSTADFISKLHISYKESRETEYWLLLLQRAKYIDEDMGESYINDLSSIKKVLSKILKSTKEPEALRAE